MQVGSRLNVTQKIITSSNKNNDGSNDALNPRDSVILGEEKKDPMSQQLDALSNLMALMNKKKETTENPPASKDENKQNEIGRASCRERV